MSAFSKEAIFEYEFAFVLKNNWDMMSSMDASPIMGTAYFASRIRQLINATMTSRSKPMMRNEYWLSIGPITTSFVIAASTTGLRAIIVRYAHISCIFHRGHFVISGLQFP